MILIVDTSGSVINAHYIVTILPVTEAIIGTLPQGYRLVESGRPSVWVKMASGDLYDLVPTIDLSDDEIHRVKANLTEYLVSKPPYPIVMENLVSLTRSKAVDPAEPNRA